MKIKILLLAAVSLIFISSCNNMFTAGKIITVKEGKHFFKPYEPTWNNDERSFFEFTFDESIRYETGNKNQCDWSKLCGYSFHKLTNHKNSLMIAFRYDRKGFIWLTPYYHEDGKRYTIGDIYDPVTGNNENVPCTTTSGQSFPYNGTLAIQAEPFQKITVEWFITSEPNYTQVTVTNTATAESFTFSKHWAEDVQRKREINAYFGGDEPAPQQITIWKKK